MNITLKVDTAVEVPVNAVPLTDDTDFKTRETGVAYNASGMDLVWNFLTTAGVISQTAVTPTTSGVYDWVHEGDGMYSMEIPASGGGSINNDTEGWGWFSGFVTGVLPFRGPTICFAPAHVVDGLVTGSDNLQVDSVQVSGDSTAADNLELQYDGTGLSGETFPATQASIDGLGSGSGGSIAFQPIEDNTGGAIDPDSTTFVGSVSSGTFASVASDDGTSHEILDDSDVITLVYGYQVGGGRLGTSVMIKANVGGNSDEMKVKAYDHVGDAWEVIGTIEGSGGTTFKTIEPVLFQKHTGTGSEIGKVYISFDTDSTTPATLDVDQCVVQAVSINQSVGYSQGAIWVDTVNGVAGTEAFVNGVADNPVDSWADALTLSASTGLLRFHIAAASSITLTADSTGCEFLGEAWTLAFGGQTVTGCHIMGATVSGTFVGSTAILENCIINAITGPGMVMRNCYLNEVTVTNNGTAGWYLNDCRSRIAGSGYVTIDYGAAVANTGFSIRNYSGGLEFQNMGQSGTDTLSLEGFGNCIFNANCSGGSASIRGNFTLTNSGSVTVSDNARYAVSRAAMNAFEAFYDAVLTDTVENGSSPTTTTFDGSGALDSSNDDIYNHCFVYFLTGDLAGVSRKVSDYDAGTSNFSFDGSTGELDAAWPIAPSADDEFMIIGLGE